MRQNHILHLGLLALFLKDAEPPGKFKFWKSLKFSEFEIAQNWKLIISLQRSDHISERTISPLSKHGTNTTNAIFAEQSPNFGCICGACLLYLDLTTNKSNAWMD